MRPSTITFDEEEDSGAGAGVELRTNVRWDDATADDEWQLGDEVERETTPLNSPAKGGGAHFSPARGALGALTADERADDEARLQRDADKRGGTDAKRSKVALGLLVLFCCDPLIDLLLLLGRDEDKSYGLYGQSTRLLARVAQGVVTVFTLLVGIYCLLVLQRWRVGKARFAALAATQFALLPEYKAICIVLDVGKLAYPQGSRVALVTVLMMVRLLEVAGLLRLTFQAGMRRKLLDTKGMPDMLRTLVSLEGAESRGLGEVAPTSERPLTVDLLEKLVVFLSPKREGSKPKEGGGLARNSALCAPRVVDHRPPTRPAAAATPAAATPPAHALRGRQVAVARG